jgi:hypothetical protein
MMSITCFQLCFGLLGPVPGDYQIGSNFWKLYLIRIDFTLSKLVSLVKMFRLFRLERSFLGVQSVNTLSRCTTSYLLAGPACLWCLVCLLLSHPLTHVWFCHITSQSRSHMIHMPLLTRFVEISLLLASEKRLYILSSITLAEA